MDVKRFRKEMGQVERVNGGTELSDAFNEYMQEALKITMEINNKYHTPEEIVELFSKLTHNDVDESFRLVPPFSTDCGVNIHVGKNVFINAGCKFQDQGGIYIDDGSFIGHDVILATLNHAEKPEDRYDMFPASIHIGKGVWIGSGAKILPGVSIGDNAIVGAGAVVTKDVEANTIVVGMPAKPVREIKE